MHCFNIIKYIFTWYFFLWT